MGYDLSAPAAGDVFAETTTTEVIPPMKGYGAVSQPIKPQPTLDRDRAGTPKQNGKMAEYLATINLSAVDKWDYELKPGRYYSVYQVISDSKNGYGWPSLSKAISAPSTPRRAR